MKTGHQIFWVRLLLTGFFIFCASVYFGCAQAFSLLSPRQTVCMAGVWVVCIRAAMAPLRFAAKRAKYDPSTPVLYYYDGIGRYFGVLGLDLLRLGCGFLLLLPGVGCLVLWYLAMGEGMVFAAGVFILCGILLLLVAVSLFHQLDLAAFGCYNKDRNQSTRGK